MGGGRGGATPCPTHLVYLIHNVLPNKGSHHFPPKFVKQIPSPIYENKQPIYYMMLDYTRTCSEG